MPEPIRIVFHGHNALPFRPGIETLLPTGTEIAVLPDTLSAEDERIYAAADAIVGVRYDSTLPKLDRLKIFHVPGAGFDGVSLALVPSSVTVCNCYGHDPAIAEYVMAALLNDCIPFADADRRLRQGDWAYTSGRAESVHQEISGKIVGILGFGHIGKLVAARAKAFDMTVHVANRSVVPAQAAVDRSWQLGDLAEFWGSADSFVICLPLNDETRSIVDSRAFATMRPDALLINVARGPVVDEADLFEALSSRRLRKAVIDTWYTYPSPGAEQVLPSRLPFHTLDNAVMTPHMSGWSASTVLRRQQTIADNVIRCIGGRQCSNVVRPATRSDQTKTPPAATRQSPRP